MPVVEVADARAGGASVLKNTSNVSGALPERKASSSKVFPSRPPSTIASKRRPSSPPSIPRL
eukprot:scaffold69374_cov57-Phaeocystis_antarctica.AAC.2